MSIKNLLVEEVESQMTQLHNMEVGSEKYKVAVNGISELVNKINEIEKLEVEELDKVEKRANDFDIRWREIEDEKKDRLVKNVLTGVSVGGGLALAVWGTCVSMKFEKEDSFTSTLGRGWVNKTISFLKK